MGWRGNWEVWLLSTGESSLFVVERVSVLEPGR